MSLQTIFGTEGPGRQLAAIALGEHDPTEVRQFITEWMAEFGHPPVGTT